MGDIAAEIDATVCLITTEAGGRRTPIGTDVGEYRCPVGLDGEYFDCRLVARDSTAIAPGECADVSIQFLFPELALPHVAVGKELTLWEGRTIATGLITNVRASSV